MVWRFFYSDMDELPAATKGLGVDRRKMPKPESSVNAGFERSRVRDLAIVAIHQPRKRILWAPTPTVVLRAGKPLLSIGAPGGRRIISALVQSLVNRPVHAEALVKCDTVARKSGSLLPVLVVFALLSPAIPRG